LFVQLTDTSAASESGNRKRDPGFPVAAFGRGYLVAMAGAGQQRRQARQSVRLWAVLGGPPILLAGLAAVAIVSLEAAGILALVVLAVVYGLVLRRIKRGSDEVFEYRQSTEYRDRPAATPNNFLGYLAHVADREHAQLERRATKQRRPSP